MSIDSSSKAALHKGYKHWCPEVEPREDWDKDFNFVLIRSIEELKKLDVEHKFVAWDTETSGLNPDIDWLVGFSFSFDGKTGYYVPVKHDDIALGKEALDIFFSILSKAGTQFLYNCRFDQRFFEAAGYSLEGLRYYDVMNAIWLADTNVLMPSLKASERRFLGWIPKTFSETLGEATTFQHVPAEDAYKYACLDENELVMMGDRSTKRICEVEVGDTVCTPNGPRKVTAVYNNGIRECYRLVWNDGSTTIATGNHKFLFHDKDTGEEVWKSVDEVFSLYQKDPRSSLNAVRITPEGKHRDFLLCEVSKFRTCNVYDIQVEEVHCFVMANGVVSHNCTDALGTYHLALISNQFYKESYPASKYDNDALYPMMRLENTPQRLDLEYLKSLCSSVETRIEESLQQVYQLAGCTFNVNSPAQFGKIMLERFGVDTGVRTPTGAMKADLKTLEAWMVKHGSKVSPEVKDFMSAYKEYKKTVKFKSSYLDKYIKAAEDADTFPVRFSYKFQSVPCLTENNTVLTKSRGFVSIKDVQSEDMIWTSWGYKRVLWNRSHEVDEFYRVTLKNGMTLEGTGHHPVLVRKSPLEKVACSGMTKDDVEWAGIQDLKPDEPVVINHAHASLSCQDSWRSSLARIVGYFYGHGRMADGEMMSLIFDNPDLSYHYEEWMKSLFGDKKVFQYDLGKGKVEYSITRQTLAKFLVEHDVIPAFDEDCFWRLDRVSTYIEEAYRISRMPDTFRHFLVGYLDSAKTPVRDLWYIDVPDDWTDGVTKDRVVFVIPSSCKDVIIPMFWASAIGCKVTNHTFKIGFCEDKVTRVEVSDPYSLSNLLSLWNTEDVGLVRFSCVELPKTFRLYAESMVQSVEHIHANTVVYDIEVEDVHEYVAGGIVTHNTGRLSCGGDKKNSFFTQNNVQCLEEDTSVITSEGIKPIKQVKTGDLVWTGSEFSQCQQLGSKTCSVLKIYTDCGEVVCSAEHLVLASDSRHGIGEFRHAGDLKVGQFVKHVGKVLSSDDVQSKFSYGNVYNPKGGVPRKEIHVDKILYDFWFSLGFFLGDGNFLRDKSGGYRGIAISVGHQDIDNIPRIQAGFKEVGIDTCIRTLKKKECFDVTSVYTKSQNLTDLFLDLDFGTNAFTKKVPSVVFRLGNKQRSLFLRGLFSSDGCCNTGVSYTSVSYTLVCEVRELLWTFGISSRISQRKDTEAYTLYVHDKEKFFEYVGFEGERRKSNVRNKSEFRLDDDGYSPARIERIESVGEAVCYDLFVPKFERFVANGFIVHNSTPKPHSLMVKGRKATQEEINQGKDILGWYLSNDIPDDEAVGLVEGMDPDHFNLRRAFLPKDDDCYVVSIDMCFESGSPVQTKRGYMGISEMVVGDEVYSPQGWVKVIRVMQTGVRKLIKVTPESGGQALYCTEDHPFIIDGQTVEARDIKSPVPVVPFYSYSGDVENREMTVSKLSVLKPLKTPKVMSEYVLKTGMKPLIESALNTYTRSNVSKWCGLNLSSFQWLMKYLGIPVTGKPFKQKSDHFYNNPFGEKSTPTSAYLLGYILGDGNISLRRETYWVLNVSSKDKAHLTRIMEVFGQDVRMRNHKKGQNEWWSLDIPSRDICQRLIKLGVVERKSTEPSKVDFGWVGDNFRHFVRGVFDADGYVRTSSGLDLSFVGHSSYIEEIHKRLEGSWICKVTPSLSHLSLRGTAEQKKFIHAYLYQGATIWLQRKRDIIEQWYTENFGDIVWPVWNCTVDTPEHLIYVQGMNVHQCAEELRLVANIYNEKTWADAFTHGKDVHKACYSPDTEFLVLDHGWMTADRITKGMKIAYYDPMDDEVRFAKAGERYSHEASEVYMHPTLFNVTDNHRMWIGTQDAGFRIVRASELKSQGNPKQKFRMKTAVGQRKSFQSIESHFGRKFGQYFCYGFMYFAPHYYDEEGFVHITLDSPCTKIPHDFALFLYSGDFSSTKFSVDRELSLGLRSLEASNPCTHLFSLAKTKYKDEPIFLQDFVYGMLVYLSSTKFNTLNLGDGSKVSGKVVVSSKEHADAIQWLLMLTGSTCRVDPSKNSLYGEGAHVLTIFSDVSSLPKSLGSTFGSVKQKNIAEKHLTYSCFSVPSGLLVTRYKGQITVNGNTAIKLFGEENYSKEARKKSKIASFGILYGSGAQGFNSSFPEMSLDECRQFLAKFKEALPSIEQGQAENVAYAREHGTINTGYGRQRRVRSYFQSGDRAQIAFAERTVKNSVVQGTAADVLKLIFCRLWANVFKPYPDVTFMSTIHDEVNFSMPKRLAREVIPICMECMTIRRDDWPVTLECSLSIGRDSLGDLIPFTYNRETKEFIPEWEESSEVLKKRTGHVETEASDNESLDVEESDDPYFGLPPEACEF